MTGKDFMEIKLIKPEELRFAANEFSARTLPDPKDKDWTAFIELKNDIDSRGLLNIFSVRKTVDGYTVVDGNRRAFAILQLWNEGASATRNRYASGLPVQIVEASDIDALGDQIAGNHHNLKQRPAALAKAAYKILLASNITISELSKKVGITQVYLEQILKINALPDEVKAMIDSGEITATNAIHLCKLPLELMDGEVIDKAKLTTGNEFLNWVDETNKAYKKAQREGKDPESVDGSIVFDPQPKLRLKEELEGMYEVALQRVESEPTDFNKGYAEAMKYAFRMDEPTLTTDRAAFELKLKEKEEKKVQRKAEREAKKKEELFNFVKNDPKLLAEVKAL